MHISELRMMNDAMIKYLNSIGKNTERNEIIKNILQENECFNKISKENAYIILKDIGISNEKIESVYLNLVSINN